MFTVSAGALNLREILAATPALYKLALFSKYSQRKGTGRGTGASTDMAKGVIKIGNIKKA